jgi:hypothetical protein
VTTANAPGYPDFQAGPNQQGQLFVNQTFTIPHAGCVLVFGGPTPQYGHTWLRVGFTTGYYQILVQMYDRFTASPFLIQDEFVATPGETRFLIPNFFSGLFISLCNSSIIAGESVNVSVGFSNAFPGGYRWWNNDNFIDTGVTNIGAGATLIYNLPNVQPGPASFDCHQANVGAAVYAEIVRLDANGNPLGTVYRINPIPQSSPGIIQLPAEPVALRIVNQTGALQTFAATLFPTGGLY